jgi:hypothetical protein
MAYAHFFAGRDEEASRLAEIATRQQPNYLAGLRILMACYAVTGRFDEAHASCAAIMQIDSSQRGMAWAPFQRPQDMQKLREAYQAAGMPE